MIQNSSVCCFSLGWRVWAPCSKPVCTSMTWACTTPAETWCWQARSSQRSWRELSFRSATLPSLAACFPRDRLTCPSVFSQMSFQCVAPRPVPSVWMPQITLMWNVVYFACRSRRSRVSWKKAWRCWTMRWRRQMTFSTGWFPNRWLKGCAKESQLWTPVRSEWKQFGN